MPVATCHCGAISLEMPPLPDEVACCGCSICRRYGALWASFAADAVTVTAAPDSLEIYAWGDRTLAFVRCRRCGCVTHREPAQGRAGERLDVNVRNLDPSELEYVNIRWLEPSEA